MDISTLLRALNRIVRALFLIVFVTACFGVRAQVNSWTNPASGNWDRATNWSLGVPPASAQSVMITNAGFKAVAIQSSTASGSLAVKSVNVTSPTNGFNTLLMNFVGAGNPLVIGVNSNNPGSLVIGNTNSAMVMFSSGLIVNNVLGANNARVGAFEVDGAFTHSDSSEVVAGFLDVTGTGTYNLTNGQVFINDEFINGTFNQQGGMNEGALIFTGGGHYNLFSGLLEGGVELGDPLAGIVVQSGGTNMGSLGLDGPGVYQLTGGLLVPGDLQVGPSSLPAASLGGGSVDQTGGTNNAGNITMGAGSYTLAGGMLTASNLSLPTASNRQGSFGTTFTQSGGFFTNGGVTMNGVINNGLQPSTYTLSGGQLVTPTITMTMGVINQTGGTNNVGAVTLNTMSSYNFTNGFLNVSNIGVAAQATFVHAGGTFGGVKNVVFTGGGWVERTTGEQLGQVQVASSTNSFLNLPSGSCVLRFADSSTIPWAPAVLLTIQNWSGSLNGGGAQQVFFGTSASGLTGQQLGEVQFLNPSGLPSGTYPARILSTGEVVPNSGVPSGPVNSWINPGSGNWDQPTNWSLGILPNSSQLVMITNGGFKAVAINPSTPVNFPGSMTVTNLTIRGATNSVNTLLLNFFGTGVPLTILNGLTLQDNAQLLDFNSALVVQSGTITVTNSHIGQDGGFIITTNAQFNLFNSEYDVTNGVFAAGAVWIGLGGASHINQFGGMVTIGALTFPFYSGPASGDRGLALHGGTLNLPGGMSLVGEGGSQISYFQDGGTNRTATMTLEPGLSGPAPIFTLNGGLLADNNVNIFADSIFTDIQQNGGTHIVSNILQVVGGARTGVIRTGVYYMNNGTLSASNIFLHSGEGTSMFIQSNGAVQAQQFQADGQSFIGSYSQIIFAGGTLSCSNMFWLDGADAHQYGGALVVSNLLSFGGVRENEGSITNYSSYELSSGTVSASNIYVGGIWSIGDSTTNRITNSGTCTLSNTIVIGNAAEQLGRFILAGNSTINLAGSASRLSFSNSSSQTWAGGAILTISNWNGNPSGGGAEQLKFGTDQTGLTAAQLNQIQFSTSSNLLSAKILSTGEVVPNNVIAANVAFSLQGNNFVLTWPTGWTLQSSTNVSGPYGEVSGAISPYTNNVTLAPLRFFRLRH
jgi:hypothetical protein